MRRLWQQQPCTGRTQGRLQVCSGLRDRPPVAHAAGAISLTLCPQEEAGLQPWQQGALVRAWAHARSEIQRLGDQRVAILRSMLVRPARVSAHVWPPGALVRDTAWSTAGLWPRWCALPVSMACTGSCDAVVHERCADWHVHRCLVATGTCVGAHKPCDAHWTGSCSNAWDPLPNAWVPLPEP